MKKLAGLAAALIGLTASTAHADGGYPWRNHVAPFAFLFGNELDTHQQTQQGNDGNLSGFLYVEYTGTVTSDGLPVATHVDCNAVTDCVVGWRLDGQPAKAMLVQQTGDHPVFWIDRADIPQPGAYSHFHWTDTPPKPDISNGYMLQLTATARFCFILHDVAAASSAVSCRANRGIRVERGTDIATHLNIIATDPTGM